EYIEGKNLKELMSKLVKNNQKMPVSVALGLMMQAASGLNYAHTFVNKVTGEAVNAIHRDISPHNLLISYEGNLKVIDFGIAKAATSMYEATRAGTLKGKIAYLSPEQINGNPVDARSDIFALGIVLWELLTLKRPFSQDADGEMTIIGRINNCDQTLVPPSTHNAEVPKALDEVVMKALQKDPLKRYQTAAEFQKALRDVMMRFYPEHSYSQTAQLIQSLFASEIAMERTEIQNLNRQAQMELTPPPQGDTVVLEPTLTVTRPGSNTKASISMTQSGVTKKKDLNEMNHVDLRIMNLELMLKQKAQSRHYLMFIFYIVSLIAIKMDDSFALLYNIVAPPKVEAQATAAAPVEKKKSTNKTRTRSAASETQNTKNTKKASY
ncbi:MAG: serine/threonine protein kinase, partial [Bdellovibrionales bacterium]